MSSDNFVLGDYNVSCHECGRKKKASQMKMHWQGYLVCPAHWEPRHPQDFVGTAPAESKPSIVQLPSDTFIDDGNPTAEPYVPPGWDDPTS